MTEETPQRRARGRKKGGKNTSNAVSFDVRVIIHVDDEPSPEYLALWRRLLAPPPTGATPEPQPASQAEGEA